MFPLRTETYKKSNKISSDYLFLFAPCIQCDYSIDVRSVDLIQRYAEELNDWSVLDNFLLAKKIKFLI